VILAEAVEAGADLIAMATHGRSGLARVFLGSVAERVLKASPIPVLVLRPGGLPTTRLNTLLVPVDGSPGGAIALAVAVGLARRADARIALVQVAVPMLAYEMADAGAFAGGVYLDPAWDEEALAAARRYVSGLADRLRRDGLRADGMAVAGEVALPGTSVADGLMRAAEGLGADLIVMSTHAHTGAARVLLGSVADAVVRNAHRPVLLVRRVSAGDQ
jgi:nucleotide-binding universal stress UspA family protein